jgi:trans-2-enoyl-CoA reductase
MPLLPRPRLTDALARDGGVAVTYGGMARRPLAVPTSQLVFRDITHRGFWLTRWVRNQAWHC